MAKIAFLHSHHLLNRPVAGMINRTISSAGRSMFHQVKCRGSMTPIRANDLKTRGIAAIESALVNSPEAVVTVRGKDKFVVMSLAHYQFLRECELNAALAETRADLAAGRFVRESATAHLARLDSL